MSLLGLISPFSRQVFFCKVTISFLIFFGVSCKPDKHHLKWNQEKPTSPDAKKKIDALLAKVNFCYSDKPDSAIFYSHKLIRVYQSYNMTYGVFNMYTKMAEIYLHQKNDVVLATKYYGEALKTMDKEDEAEITNPYFYIDYGSIFWANEIEDQAIINFRKAIEIAKRQKNDYAVTVGLSNLGLTYKIEKNLDSARIYFLQAAELRKKLMPILVADSYRQLCYLFIELKSPADSILVYKTKMQQAYQQHLNTPVDTSIIHRDYILPLEKKIDFNIAYLNAVYLDKQKKGHAAVPFYKEAIRKAWKNNYVNELCRNYYNLGNLCFEQLDDAQHAILYADSSYHQSKLSSNYEYAVFAAKLLADLHQKIGNSRESHFYMSEAMRYSDSSMTFETSEHRLAIKVKLVNSQTQNEIRLYEKKQEDDKVIIDNQNRFIILLSLLILIIGGLLYRIFKNNRRLKEEYLFQMERILKELETAEKQTKERKDEKVPLFSSDEFSQDLALLMNEKKIFTQNNLSLPELAQMLNTNQSYLSQYLNNHLGTNFSDYINSFRVKEACRIMVEDQQMKYSIDQIAGMVGFNSRSTFYSTFNKFTGITPAFFRKNLPVVAK